jgi:hypothetical protein
MNLKFIYMGIFFLTSTPVKFRIAKNLIYLIFIIQIDDENRRYGYDRN